MKGKKLAKRDAQELSVSRQAMSSFRATSDENKWLFCLLKYNMMMGAWPLSVCSITYHHIRVL